MLVFWFHQFVLLSFTLLFIQFFNKRYSEDGRGAGKVCFFIFTLPLPLCFFVVFCRLVPSP
jgi:predicted transporter